MSDLSGAVVEVKAPVPKKPRSAAQQAATAKALSILKERREAKEKAEQDVKDSKVLAKQKTREHKKKDLDNPVVTKKMLDEALKAHEKIIREASKGQEVSLPPPPKPVAVPESTRTVAPSAPAPAPAPIANKAPSRSVTPTKLVGRELLDALFFK
jgi:hypothetical protein